MTLEKAQQIVEKVVAAVSLPSAPLVRRMSELGGYSFDQIEIAIKLSVAHDYCECSAAPSASVAFRKKVAAYDAVFVSLPGSFVPDIKIDEIAHLKPDSMEYRRAMLRLATEWKDETNPDYQRWLRSETITSFGNFCLHIGTRDSLYWQKVFTYLGLAYGPTTTR